MSKIIYESDLCVYLFLSITWNQKPGTDGLADRRPIHIGLLSTDDDLAAKKIMSKCIRPERESDISENTLQQLRTTRHSIMEGRSEEDILRSCAQSFQSYRYLVVWSRDIYDLYCARMKAYGLSMPRHHVVVLRDLMALLCKTRYQPLSFGDALRSANIAYDQIYINLPKHNVKYLHTLYKTLYTAYLAQSPASCQLNRHTNKLHVAGYRYYQSDPPGKIVAAVDQSAALHGYQPCKVCQQNLHWNLVDWSSPATSPLPDPLPEAPSQPRPKKVPKAKPQKARTRGSQNLITDHAIIELCKQYNLRYSLSVGMFYVYTGFGNWRIHYHGDKVTKVFHENFYKNSSVSGRANQKTMQQYHQQQIKTHNLRGVLHYIFWHDKNLVYRMNHQNPVDHILQKMQLSK